jgi:Flp pilus assembly protein TadD
MLVERSKALTEIRRWKEAEAQARRAIEADPTYPRALLQLAHVLAMLGRDDESAQLAKGALALDPTSFWATRILCSWHGAHGRHAEAVAHAELAVRLSGGDRESLLALSNANLNAGDMSGARGAAERLVSSFPDWPEGFLCLAMTRHSPEEAAQALREALRLDPHCDAALADLAGLSGSLAQYREAVSLAWSSLRSDPTAKARQRLFARSAWIYLWLSRIVAPLRGTHQALAESFGESCAFAFHATGDTLASRLLFAFRLEVVVLVTWLVFAVAMIASGYLPDALSGVLVPLLGIPVFFGLAVPFFLFFRGIAAARRLLDLRIIQWGGRGSLRSLVARAAVSGSLLVAVAVALLLAFPLWANAWGWFLLIGLVLAVQDLFRWRDQWRDSRRANKVGSIRRAMAASLSERAGRWFTSGRLATFATATAAAEITLLHTGTPPDPAVLSLVASTAVFALAVIAIDWVARNQASRLGPGPRAYRWLAFGRSLVDLSWMIAAAFAIVILGGRLVEGAAIEALFPIFLLPFIVGGGWLALRALRAMLMLVAVEVLRAGLNIGKMAETEKHPPYKE